MTYENLLYQDVQIYSKYLRAHANFDDIDDILHDRMVKRMSIEILSKKVHEQTYTIEEAPVYDSPRHAFVASLPMGSFRRRFFCFLWGLDPNSSHMKQRTHEVRVKRWIELPEVGVPKQSIEETMGFWA